MAWRSLSYKARMRSGTGGCVYHTVVSAFSGASSGVCVQMFAQHNSASLLMSVMLILPHSWTAVLQYMLSQRLVEKIPVCARWLTRTQTACASLSTILEFLYNFIISNAFATLWPGPRENKRSIQILVRKTDNKLNYLVKNKINKQTHKTKQKKPTQNKT